MISRAPVIACWSPSGSSPGKTALPGDFSKRSHAEPGITGPAMRAGDPYETAAGSSIPSGTSPASRRMRPTGGSARPLSTQPSAPSASWWPSRTTERSKLGSPRRGAARRSPGASDADAIEDSLMVPRYKPAPRRRSSSETRGKSGPRPSAEDALVEVAQHGVLGDPLLPHRVALAHGHRAGRERLAVDGDAERRADLVHAPVAPPDRGRVVVEHHVALLEVRVELVGALRHPVLAHERQHCRLVRRESRVQ